MGVRIPNVRQVKCEVVCAHLAHRAPFLKPYGLYSIRAVEDQIF